MVFSSVRVVIESSTTRMVAGAAGRAAAAGGIAADRRRRRVQQCRQQRVGLQYQHRPALAVGGEAGDQPAVDADQVRRPHQQRAHVAQALDHQEATPAAHRQQRPGKPAVGRARSIARPAQQRRQPGHRREAARLGPGLDDAQQRPAIRPHDLRGVHQQQPLHRIVRQPEQRVAGLHQQQRLPPCRQRHRHQHDAAAGGPAPQRRDAVQPPRRLGHDRQPHAAAGQAVDPGRGGEARLEGDRQQGGLVRFGIGPPRQQPALARYPLDPAEVGPGPVILDPQLQPADLQRKRQLHLERHRPARLQPVADRVAQQLDRRVAQALQHLPLRQQVHAAQPDHQLAALLARQLPRHPGQRTQHAAGLDQGDPLQLRLQRRDRLVEPLVQLAAAAAAQR